MALKEIYDKVCRVFQPSLDGTACAYSSRDHVMFDLHCVTALPKGAMFSTLKTKSRPSGLVSEKLSVYR